MKNSSSESGPATAAEDTAAPHRVETYVYRDSGMVPPHESDGDWLADAEAETPAPGGITEEQAQAREERARDQARNETRDALWGEAQRQAEQLLRAELEQGLDRERDALHIALRQFAQQRHDYFHQLEREVVQLLLAITHKVLQRESLMDPLLLAGTVRVALDQLAGAAAVELHVPPSQLSLWEERLRLDPEMKSPPRLRPDPALEPSGCRLQTETGSSDLSLTSQMREIEQGFLDLLSRRPPPAKTAAASLP